MTKKHMLILVVCCLAPVVAIGAILLFQIPISQALLVLMVLLCPLSHLLMMKFMPHDGVHLIERTNDHHASEPISPEARPRQIFEEET